MNKMFAHVFAGPVGGGAKPSRKGKKAASKSGGKAKKKKKNRNRG